MKDSTAVPDDADDIAIIGIGLRFPDATDLNRFRENLVAGRDSVRPMPEERAVATGLGSGRDHLPMGYLNDIHLFDYAFFGLSRREASVMDPQQRMALVLAHRAISDAGYAVSTLRAQSTAIVFSAPAPHYHGLAVNPGPLGALGNMPFGTPARIAHLLDLPGPCYAVDSGCNGSLVAVHHGCREITSGAAEYAIVGGVSLHVNGGRTEEAGFFGEIVSASGRCRAFDAEADGTVPGEGGAALLMTTVDRALAERAPIHAVVRGSAVAHHGRAAATISTPSAPGQMRVITKAWQAAGASLHDAGYLEAHGSGTRLGDAIELEGIASMMAGRAVGRRLPIGSVKTNIGHLDHAAGIAGLVKAVSSVSRGELYQSLHFASATDGFDLDAAGIEVVTAARPWTSDRPRMAGVSSYSLGGINAHCVVAQPPETQSSNRASRERIRDGAPLVRAARLIGVSARSAAALAELCADLAAALSAAEPDIEDVAYTLGLGRDHFEYRRTVRACSTGELVEALEKKDDSSGAGAVTRPAVVLLMSPDAVPSGVTPAGLPRGFTASGRAAAVVARQIAVHDRLRACGIEFAAVLSAGVCRYAARHVLGFPVEFDSAATEPADSPIDEPQLIRTARALLSTGPVVFVDPSSGVLGRILRAEFCDHPAAQVLCAASDSVGLLDMLGYLYERGVDLDWSALTAPDGHRLRLPGHPMHGSPCWLDRPEVPRRPEPVPTRNSADAAVDPLQWLCSTLGELLDSETDIPPDADFFELGANSIIATQLVDRVDRVYGFRPKLIDVYEQPTVSDFARLLRTAAIASDSEPVQRETVPHMMAAEEPVLSFGQERMWFHHRFEPATTLYNYPVACLLRGPMDVAAVRGTLADLIARHETLRYNFVERNGAPVLNIRRPDLGEIFRYRDVSAESDPRAAARELVRTTVATPFDLAVDPLLRVSLIRIGPDEHVLQITCHHAITDGATPLILSREIPELYAARRQGRPHSLAPLPVRYRDYAAWQRRLLASSALDHELRYWVDTLRGAPALNLPTDFPRPPRKTFTGAVHPYVIPRALVTELRVLAKRESVSLYVVLLTGLYLLLARYSGQRDIVVGTPTSGRNRSEFDGIIGYFNSTVALRATISGETTLSALLEHVRAVVFGALENQEIPFDRVVSALNPERDLSRTPLFDVTFLHQLVPLFTPHDDGHDVVEMFDVERSPANAFPGIPAGTAKFDLTFVTSELPGADTQACIEFSTDLFTEQTVARMAEVYLEMLETMTDAATSAAPIGSLLAGPDLDDSRSTLRASLPTDRARAETGTAAIELVSTSIDLDTAREPALFGDGPDALLISVWATLLAWYGDADRVVIGLASDDAGRIPAVCVDLSDEPTGYELIERVRRALGEAHAGDTAAETFCYFGERPGPGRPGPEPSSRGMELGLSWRRSGLATVTVDMAFSVDLFDRSTALAMVAELTRLLAALLEGPDALVYELALDAVDTASGARAVTR